MSLFDTLIRYGMPLVPKPIVGTVARRYVAGNTLDEAITTIRSLNAEGAMATIDVLGEAVSKKDKAEAAFDEYLRGIDRIVEEKVDANISVKPTLLGFDIDEALCLQLIDGIVKRAKDVGLFVRIDMEDHTTTDATLRIYRTVLERHGNAGVALQAYLRRLVADINDILPLKPNIRLCKGIYREPRDVAWQSYGTVRANYCYSLEKLLQGGAYVGIATHDEHLVWHAMATIDRLGLDPKQYEFQMLLGVDPDLRRIILANGHRLRVYVPYGRDWYPYSIRRLRENPTIALHVMRAMLGIKPK